MVEEGWTNRESPDNGLLLAGDGVGVGGGPDHDQDIVLDPGPSTD